MVSVVLLFLATLTGLILYPYFAKRQSKSILSQEEEEGSSSGSSQVNTNRKLDLRASTRTLPINS